MTDSAKAPSKISIAFLIKSRLVKSRLVKIGLGFIVTLILLLAAGLSWIYTTESGLQFVVNQVNSMFSSSADSASSSSESNQQKTQLSISLGQATGSLSSHAKLSSIQVKSPDLELMLEDFSIQCHWLELLRYKALCRSLEIKRVVINQKSKSANTEAPKPITSADIQQYLKLLNTDIKVDIDSIAIGQLSLEPSLENPLYHIEQFNDIQVDTLRLQNAKFEAAFKANSLMFAKAWPGLKIPLTSVLENHLISAKVQIQNQPQDHDIQVSISGPQGGLNLRSFGSSLTGAEATLDISQPIKANLRGSWKFADDRIYFNQGRLSLNQLPIDYLDDIELTAETKIELSWPKLTVELDAKLESILYGVVNSHGSISLDSMLSPLDDSQINLKSDGQLTPSALQQIKQAMQKELEQHSLELEPTNILSIDPHTINLDITVNAAQKKLYLDQVNVAFAQNKLQVKGVLDSENWKSLQLNGTIQSSALSLPNHISLSKADLQWQLNTLSTPIKMEIKGKIAQAQYQQYLIEGFEIDSHLQQEIKSRVKIKKLRADNLLMRELDWNVSGTLAKHTQNIKWLAPTINKLVQSKDTQYNNIKANEQYAASFNGQFIEPNPQQSAHSSDWQYLISQFSGYGDLIKSQQPITIQRLHLSPSKVNVQQACINQKGRLCLQAQFPLLEKTGDLVLEQTFEQNTAAPDKQTTQINASYVKLDMQQFDFQLVNQIIAILQLENAPNIFGTASGKLHVAIKDNRITQLEAELDSPKLKIEQKDNAIQFEQLKVASKDIDATHSIIAIDIGIVKLPNQMAYEKKRDKLNAANQLTSALIPPIGPIGIEHTNIKATFLHQPEQLNIEKLDFNSFLIARIDQKSDEAIRKALPNQQVKKHNPQSDFNGALYHQAQITGSLNQKSQQIQHKIRFNYPPHVQGLIEGNVDFTSDEPTLDSRAQLNLADMQFIQLFVPSIDAISGNYQQNLHIRGDLSAPTITGDGNLVLDTLKIIELGINISRSEFKTSMDQNQIALNGFVNTSLGTLDIDGLMQYQPKLNARLLVSGDKIQIVNNQNYLLIVSPNVNTTFVDNLLKSQGKVVIEQAKLTIKKLPKTANLPSDDEIIVSNKRTKLEKPALQYELDIEAEVADKLVIDAMGLKASAKGKVRVQSQPNRLTRTTGKLELIDGEFEMYKQKLNITNGHLVFLGSAENPNIYFRAVRVIDEYKVGVIGEGSVINPKLELFSEPALPPEDIVSLIVTGRKISSLNEKGGNMFTNSVISLGVEEADKIARKLGEQLGLKNIGVSCKTKADSTSIKLDSQINEKLSVGFGTVINSQQQTQTGWIIEYSLAPNLTLEAQSGDEVNTMLTYKKTFQSGDVKKASTEEESKEKPEQPIKKGKRP
jgi:translocation and assembly module TamB